MNVWEFLGLPSDHRSEDNIVQYVKNHDEVPEVKKKFPRIVQIKKDGVFALLMLSPDREFACFGRTGQRLVNLDHIAPQGFVHPQTAVVLIAEVCCDECSLESLSGLINPKRVNPLDDEQKGWLDKIYFVYHDMLWLQEFIDGISYRPYRRREATMTAFMNNFLFTNTPGCRTISSWVECEDELEAYAQSAIDDGEEGVVSKDPGAPWIAGKRNEAMTKIVRGVDFDLLVKDVVEGEGKRKGMAGVVMVQWRKYGKPDGEPMDLPVDLNFDDNTKKRFLANPELIVGSIVHVHALQIGSKGALRLPKVKTIRYDKTTPDL